jgi:tRNA C32,U32 (ribose-2'-O)-methylase TrmJ
MLRVAQRAHDLVPRERVALVFGSEADGLSGDECAACQELVSLPCSAEHGSLNLSMAVTVVLYSLYTAPQRAKRSGGEPLTGAARAYLVAHVADALGAAAKSAQAKALIEASVQRVFSRAELETRDALAWHQIMRALGNAKHPADYGIEGA